jgi:putative acetyltransferase
MQNPPEPPPWIIRAACPSDAAAITALVNLPGFRAGTLRLPFQTVAQTAARFENAGPNAVSLVAELDGQIVGDAGLTRYTGRRIHAAGIGMGVHDDFCGRGIGRALLSALLDCADNWLQIRRVELTVYADNQPAIRLYQRHGFEAEGTLHDFAFRDGAYVDALTMARLKR